MLCHCRVRKMLREENMTFSREKVVQALEELQADAEVGLCFASVKHWQLAYCAHAFPHCLTRLAGRVADTFLLHWKSRWLPSGICSWSPNLMQQSFPGFVNTCLLLSALNPWQIVRFRSWALFGRRGNVDATTGIILYACNSPIYAHAWWFCTMLYANAIYQCKNLLSRNYS